MIQSNPKVKRTEESKKKEFVSLDEILKGGIVLIDGCIQRSSEKKTIREMYSTTRYQQINLLSVSQEIEGIEKLSKLLELENVFTIQGVADEFQRYTEIIGEKRSHLSKTQKMPSQKHRKGEEYRNSTEDRDASLEELHDCAFTVHRQMLSKRIPVGYLGGSERYKMIEKMVQVLEEEIRLKKDTSYLLGEHDTDRARESHTDEKLVASAFCASMHAAGPIKILTQDTDFISLTGVLPRLLGSDSFLPCNVLFRDSLRMNPVILYFKTDEGYEKAVDTSDDSRVVFLRDFRIYNTNTPKNKEIKAELATIWDSWFDYTIAGSLISIKQQ